MVVLKLEDEVQIPSGAAYQFNQIGSLEDDVKFWDIDNPYLYRVNSVVIVEGKEVDFVENKIGLRKFEFRATAALLAGQAAELCWRDDGSAWISGPRGHLIMQANAA